ncbi:MAG TPA: hypothetical protein VLG76_01375 [Rhabdochlamydiaceae bacterium]|nr:hypothetical protein [Rhabdochlamydiaceae bacterium]
MITSKNYIYENTSVCFVSVGKELSVVIDTPHLQIKSVDVCDIGDIWKLYKKEKTLPEITRKVANWETLWEAGNPCSVLAVRLNGSSNQFIGYLGLKRKCSGFVKLFGHGYSDYWNVYGYEATAAVTQAYVRGINAKLKPEIPFCLIEAETEVNKNSNQILRKFGQEHIKEEMSRYAILLMSEI